MEVLEANITAFKISEKMIGVQALVDTRAAFMRMVLWGRDFHPFVRQMAFYG